MKYFSLALLFPLFLIGCEKPSTETDSSSVAPSVPLEDQEHVLAKKGHIPAAGSTHLVSTAFALKKAKMNMAMMGQKMNGTMSTLEETTLKVEYKSDSSVVVTMVKSESQQDVLIAGQKQGADTPPSDLLNRPVSLEKKDGVWAAQPLEDSTKEIEKKIEEFAKKFNEPDDLKIYGAEARKVGDTWESTVADLFGVDEGKGTLKLEFKEIKEHEGVLCAYLVGKLSIAGSMELDADQKIDMTLKGDIELYRALDGLYDVSLAFEGDLDAEGDLEPAPGVKVSMLVTGPVSVTEKTEQK